MSLASLGLKRYPHHYTSSPLQAWDAADELLVEHVRTLSSPGRILVMGDHFGALVCGLSDAGLNELTLYTDSFISRRGSEENLQQHGLKPPLFIHDLNLLDGPYDTVLVRIPKNLSHFEDQLLRLRPHLSTTAQVVCGYRIKHHSKGSFELLDKIIGPTQTSLAQKKARLIFAKPAAPDASAPVGGSRFPLRVSIDGFAAPFIHHSNVFSREKLDIGTRFFLEHVPSGNFGTIVDLGCGNGVVGIHAQRLNPSAQLIFTDESWMAIESARANAAVHAPAQAPAAQFFWCDALADAGLAPESADWVLCNPPFHEGTTLSDQTARRMFAQAKQILKPGGTLRVIGNHALRYPEALQQIFNDPHARIEIIARNAKFTIVDART